MKKETEDQELEEVWIEEKNDSMENKRENPKPELAEMVVCGVF